MTDERKMLTGFWHSFEYRKHPETGKKLIPILFDPYDDDEPFYCELSIVYGYLWKGKPVLRRTKEWFQFSPSVPPWWRILHNPASGRHLAQSFFHDDAYSDLWKKKVSQINIVNLIQEHAPQMSEEYFKAIERGYQPIVPRDTRAVPVDPKISREEADELWRAVGAYFKADEIDEELTFLGLRIGGGVAHWLKDSRVGKMVGL